MKSDDLISRSALKAKAKTIYMEFDNVALPTRVISIADLHLAPAVDAMPKWISVEDALPNGSNGFDFCETVIVYTQDEQVTTGWNNCGEWYLLNWDNEFISKHPADYVTHWMPLPEPPKENNT